jgi:hypothetical protein
LIYAVALLLGLLPVGLAAAHEGHQTAAGAAPPG